MDVGANYLREHMEETDRLHHAIVDPGGTSPNVVQAYTRGELEYAAPYGEMADETALQGEQAMAFLTPGARDHLLAQSSRKCQFFTFFPQRGQKSPSASFAPQ